MSAKALLSGGAFAAACAAAYSMMMSNTQEVSAKEEPKKVLLRRHSTGEHAFFPDKTFRDAKRAASQAKNFGVDDNHVHDGEGHRLPTTRGY